MSSRKKCVKFKLFKDPVQGNLEIEDWICLDFIDTDVFQRLRFVEQSSMRMLFPGARHDRFIHSIGVFAIARKMFRVLKPQLKVGGVPPNKVSEMEYTFILAALLHDCAHSPFSHTGEIVTKKYCRSKIEKLLVGQIKSKAFFNDFYDASTSSGNVHEQASAYLGCARFASEFKRHSVNSEQFARMIIGLKNKANAGRGYASAYNCLIQLINGFVVDADRLDYLLRDTWATGVANAAVDVDRLLSGLEVDVRTGFVSIQHKSLSSVVNAVMARDYFYKWIMPHHKVVLANLLLVRAIDDLLRVLHRKSAHKVSKRTSVKKIGEEIFSPERLLLGHSYKVCGEEIIFPTDGDILYLMKKHIPNNCYVRGFLFREKEFISVWKTYPEFLSIFKVAESRKYVFSDPKFWEFFRCRLEEFCKGKALLYSSPDKIKETGCELRYVDVKGLISKECAQNLNFDDFLPLETSQRFYFNLFARKGKGIGIKKLIIDLKALLLREIENYMHLCR